MAVSRTGDALLLAQVSSGTVPTVRVEASLKEYCEARRLSRFKPLADTFVPVPVQRVVNAIRFFGSF